MARKKKPEDPPPGAPLYMTTYGDMMTLLLCFFVLIVSFSTMEIEKFKAAAASLKGAFSVLPYQEKVTPSKIELSRPSKGEEPNARARKQQRAVMKLRRVIREHNLSSVIKVNQTPSGVHITIGDPALFDTGRAEIKQDILPVLNQVVEVVSEGDETIRVEGHTDNVPIHTAQYRSNWDLSIARALSVIGYIREGQPEMDPRRLRPVGCAEFHPVASNDTPEGRALNRRVEIFIEF